MSHSRIRKEKDCLNCGAVVEGRYCPACGQENLEPKQTLWHLLTHFFSDITHFDGKFFTTVRPLIFRPGFLSSEYIKGRRTKYLDPVRMYLFISAIFALVFISFNREDMITEESPECVAKVDSIRHSLDSVNAINKTRHFNVVTDTLKDGTEIMVFNTPDSWRQTLQHYDSTQKAMKPSLRDGWFEKYIMTRTIKATHAYERNPYFAEHRMLTNFYHSFSKLFFVSLPIFATVLFLIYIRKRKQYYFVSHAIFSIHYYCVILVFWSILYIMPAALLPKRLATPYCNTAPAVIILTLIVYLFIAQYRFYKQGWGKTLLKFLILSVATGFVLLIIFLGLFLNSALDIAH